MILVICPDPVVSTTLREAGFEVELCAGDTTEVLDRAAAAAPELIVASMDVPSVDVCALAVAHWRDLPQRRTPILALSASADGDCIVEMLELGLCDYIVGPIVPKVLVARVQAMVRRHSERPAARRPQPGAAPRLERVSPVRVGEQVFELRTGYQPAPENKIVTTILRDGEPIKRHERAQRNADEASVRAAMDEQHRVVEQLLRVKSALQTVKAPTEGEGAQRPAERDSAPRRPILLVFEHADRMVERGNVDDALSLYAGCLESDQAMRALLGVARCALARGSHEDLMRGRDALERLDAGRMGQSLRLTGVVQSHGEPTPVERVLEQADSMFEVGDVNDALSLYVGCLETDHALRALCGLARCALACGDHDETLCRFEARHPAAVRSKAMVLHRLGRAEEGRALFERAIEAQPEELSLWKDYSHYLNSVGDLRGLIEACQRATGVFAAVEAAAQTTTAITEIA